MNIERRDSLTKEFIEENYIDKNGFVLVEEMQIFLDCKTTTTVFNTCRRFEVKYIERKTNSHLNQKNLSKLSKNFIEENFLDKNKYVLVNKFMEFINCKSSKIFNLCKKFKVSYKVSTSKNINQNNLMLVSKGYIEKYFIDNENYIKVKEFMLFLNCSNENMVYKLCRKHKVNFTVRVPNQAHLNQNNLKILTKEYIEEHFIDENNFIKMNKFQSFLGCKDSSTTRSYCKKFKVEYDRQQVFDRDNEAILYYIKDNETNLYKLGITNKTIESRFSFTQKSITILQIIKFDKGKNAFNVEQALHKHFNAFRVTNQSWINEGIGGRQHMNGATEFFNKDVLNKDKV